MRCLLIPIILVLVAGCVFFFFLADIRLPAGPPRLSRTFTPQTQRAPLEIGSYDVLGNVISREDAQQLLETDEGREMLSREQGAIEITEDLVELGREAFYLETFGNEVFLTDIVGILDGPVNLVSVGRAVLGLRGDHTTNLQVRLDEDIEVGGRTFREGTLLDTGLDVPAGSLFPLGMSARIYRGRVQVGVTCALCHATVDPDTGLILEGATNIDIDTGLIMAMASNSAAMFRHTDINPIEFPSGERTYTNSEGQRVALPDADALEAAVDELFLAWPPGTFDPSMDLEANPTFIPSSYTFGQWPYGWNGFGSVGWFQGLTTLNNNVHAVSADGSTDALLFSRLHENYDEDTYMALLLQNAPSDFRLPEGARPTAFFQSVTPTPNTPGIIELVVSPNFPDTSVFLPTGLMASRYGYPVGEHINGLSAFQNTLAPPPQQANVDLDSLRRGAQVFQDAGCAECHSGRFFSNNQVIPLSEIGTQPSRAIALAGLQEFFEDPVIYPPSLNAPVQENATTIPVPTDTTPEEIRDLAYVVDGEGGYKAITLIGVYLHAPYLHDGSVAAGPGALQEVDGQYIVADTAQLGMAGTLQRGIHPDAAASLRVLLDRELRAEMIAANRADPDLQRTNIEGIGHEFWVDEAAGFTVQDQSELIVFLLSLDDDPGALEYLGPGLNMTQRRFNLGRGEGP